MVTDKQAEPPISLFPCNGRNGLTQYINLNAITRIETVRDRRSQDQHAYKVHLSDGNSITLSGENRDRFEIQLGLVISQH